MGEQMREIKFRVWGADAGVGPKMWPWPVVREAFDLWLSDTDAYVMQFTGLLDKNGKEIYEGDIGFFEDYWIGDHRQVGGQGIVKWVDDGFTVFAFDEYQSDLWNMVHNYSFEVIGNIYEGIKDERD